MLQVFPCIIPCPQVLQMAGIEDCYTASRGNTKTQVQPAASP